MGAFFTVHERTNQTHTHTQTLTLGFLSVGELLVTCVQLRKSPHHHMSHPPAPQAQISITHPNLSLPHPPHHRHNQNPPSVSHSPNRPAPLFSLPSAVRWRSDIISAQTDTHRISNPSSRLCATLTPKAVVGL